VPDFVRGTGASYIHAAGRWRCSASVPVSVKSQSASSVGLRSAPRPPRGPSCAPATSMCPPGGTCAPATVCLPARTSSPSKSVSHSDAVCAAPGRWWTVWRSQNARGSLGWCALTNQLS
jgi:hypothetical protein